MRHGFPPPILIVDDVEPQAMALEQLCFSPDVEPRPVFTVITPREELR
jgi:hypothetical protein